MSETTQRQRVARRRNAAKASEARRAAAAERRAAAEAALEKTYEPVHVEVNAAIEAICARKPDLAARRVQVALMLLARIATTQPFDPARSRAAMLALRAAQQEATRGMR